MSYQFNSSHPSFNELRKNGRRGLFKKNAFKVFEERVETHEETHVELWTDAHNQSREYTMDTDRTEFSYFAYFLSDGNDSEFKGTTEEILTEVYGRIYEAAIGGLPEPTKDDIKFAKEVATQAVNSAFVDLNKQIGKELGEGLGENKVREATTFSEEDWGTIMDMIKPYDEESGAKIEQEIKAKIDGYIHD